MALTLLLLTFTMFWTSSSSIRCYHCVPEATYAVAEVKCEEFDASERFIINCPNSSMCYKRVSELELSNDVTSKSYQRGCASQTLSGDQKKIDGKWRMVHDIQEVYPDACTLDATDADRITKTLHCYCRGELCNGSLTALAHLNNLLFIIAACLALMYCS